MRCSRCCFRTQYISMSTRLEKLSILLVICTLSRLMMKKNFSLHFFFIFQQDSTFRRALLCCALFLFEENFLEYKTLAVHTCMCLSFYLFFLAHANTFKKIS